MALIFAVLVGLAYTPSCIYIGKGGKRVWDIVAFNSLCFLPVVGVFMWLGALIIAISES